MIRPQAAPVPPPEEEDQRTLVQRRPVVLWAVIAALVVALVGAGVWWFSVGEKGADTIAVPPVSGMDQATAEKTLHDAGLSVTVVRQFSDTVGAGKAIGSDPQAGSSVPKNSAVTLVLSSGRPTVPDISPGTELAQAEAAVKAAGLTPRRDEAIDGYSTSVPAGKVLVVDPRPGTQLTIGSPVRIGLSQGAPPTPVPSVVGLSRNEAFQRLKEAGFEPYDAGTEFAEDVPNGSVTRTTPAAGTTIDGQGSKRVGVFTSSAVEVPSVLGRPVQDAIQLLSDAGLQADVQGRTRNFSIVVGQDPEPGEWVERGKKVKLQVFP
ncbi:PASTA domain-containing protein [Amycolatopsis thermalba]|uniref:PASTA domain-containing protein n=2 Tax=Amycolatopsis TaxID=1813 RepID=A0ABY4P268_9PSEU|nr:PASTA domain-containing protein [Amycolatopsis thermalba]